MADSLQFPARRRVRLIGCGAGEMRGPLLPRPFRWRSRAERFDMAVLEAYEPIERRWHQGCLRSTLPSMRSPIAPKDPDSVQWPPEVVADGSDAGAAHSGGSGRPR